MKPWSHTKAGLVSSSISRTSQVYLGKEGPNIEHKVVKNLIAPLENKYYHLYMDNFYCDPYSFKDLDCRKVLACGTVRCNGKGFPKDLVVTKAMEKRMNHGNFIWRCNGTLLQLLGMTADQFILSPPFIPLKQQELLAQYIARVV